MKREPPYSMRLGLKLVSASSLDLQKKEDAELMMKRQVGIISKPRLRGYDLGVELKPLNQERIL